MGSLTSSPMKKEMSASTVVFVTIFIISVFAAFFIYDDYRSKNDEYIVQIEYAGRQTNYHFPSAAAESLQSIGAQIVKCKDPHEESVSIYLYRSGRIVRHLSYCPSEVGTTTVRQEYNPE